MKEKSFSVPSSERLLVAATTASRVSATSRSTTDGGRPKPRRTKDNAPGKLRARCFTSRPGMITGKRECSLISKTRR
jgi:hypothetical protein